MNRWFGHYSAEKLPEGVLANEQYGKLIAEELFRQLK